MQRTPALLDIPSQAAAVFYDDAVTVTALADAAANTEEFWRPSPPSWEAGPSPLHPGSRMQTPWDLNLTTTNSGDAPCWRYSFSLSRLRQQAL